jgi:hypothetical protein
MAFAHGRKAAISINSVLLTAYANSAALNVDIDTAETSTFGNTWKTNVVGMAGAKVDVEGFYDPTVSVGPQSVIEPLIGADPFACIYYPAGNTTGQSKHAFNAILTSYNETSTTGDAVKWTASLILTGPDTITAVP